MPPESPPASPPNPPAPPIADYELLRLIGRGSYGDVWLARGVTGVFRAVKIVWRDRFPDVRPYEREFEGITRFAAISLREPSQLALLHAGRQDAAGFFYYVMELADDTARGREIDPASYTPCTLKDFAAQRGHRLETAEVVALGTALARALASLHAAGLVHRDIKPSNVILVGGVPKLADVGLVALASAQLTFVGTEGFVPPEGPGAPSADVYSLGKLLYELATGLDRHDWPRLPPDLDTRPDQRALLELNEVLVRACEPDARQRFQDAAALLDELLLLQAGKSVRRLRRAERRTARALRFAAALALVAGLAGIGAYIERQRANEETQLRRAAEAERDAERRRSVYTAGLARTQRALETDDLGRARKLLAESIPARGEPDLRGFEWHALWHEAQGDPAVVLREKGATIDRIVVSPDESHVAAHDKEKVVTVYNAARGTTTGRISGISQLGGWSVDGSTLLGSNPDGRLQRWRATDGASLGSPSEERFGQVLGVRADDEIVALTRTPDFSVVQWSSRIQRVIARIQPSSETNKGTWEFFSSDLDHSGRWLSLVLVSDYAGAGPRRIIVLDLERGEICFDRPYEDRPMAALTSHDGVRVAFASGHGIRHYGFDGNERISSSLAISGSLFGVSRLVGPEGRVVVRDDSSAVRVVAPDGNGPTRTLRGASSRVLAVASSAAHKRVFVGGFAGELRMFDLQIRTMARERDGFWSGNLRDARIVYSPDGTRLLAPLDGDRCAIVDADSLEVVGELPRWELPLAWNRESLWGWGDDHRTLHRMSAPDGPVSCVALELPQHVGPVAPTLVPCLAPTGELFAAGFAHGTFGVWSAADGKFVRICGIPGVAIWSLAFTADGRRLWSSDNNRRLVQYDTRTGETLRSFHLPARAPALLLTADGKWLLIGSEEGTVEVHDAESGAARERVATGSGIIYRLAQASVGGRIFAGGSDGRVHVIDPSEWTVVAELTTGSSRQVMHLAVPLDGNQLTSLNASGFLRVWRSN